MTYDSHAFTSILSISNMPPPAVQPITSSCTAWSGTFYNFALCSHCGSAGTSSHLIPYIEIGPVHSHRILDSSLLAHLRDSGSLPILRSSQALWEIPDCSSILVFHLYLTCLYLPFAQSIIREDPHNCLYQFPPELRFSTYASHRLTLISHYFASHHTATIPLSLLATTHLETIPCPQIAPPQSPIGFILRSLAP